MPKWRYPPGGRAKMVQSTGWSVKMAPGTRQPTPLDWTKQLLALSSACTCLEPAAKLGSVPGSLPQTSSGHLVCQKLPEGPDSPYHGRTERSLRLCSLHCPWTSAEPLAQLGVGGLRGGGAHFQPKTAGLCLGILVHAWHLPTNAA